MLNIFECEILKKIRSILHKLIKSEIYYINGSETLPAPLSLPEEQALVRALADGDDSARRKLIEHNLRLVVYIARKFENAVSANIEDLISIGTIGLIKAVNTFKADKNIKLATYASRCIENEILMYLRKSNHARSEISIEEPLNIDWDGNELLLGDILGTENDEVSKDIENEVEIEALNSAIDRLNGREKQIMQLRFGLNGNK